MTYLYRYPTDGGGYDWVTLTGVTLFTLGPDRVLRHADGQVVVTDVDLAQAYRTLRQLGHTMDQIPAP